MVEAVNLSDRRDKSIQYLNPHDNADYRRSKMLHMVLWAVQKIEQQCTSLLQLEWTPLDRDIWTEAALVKSSVLPPFVVVRQQRCRKAPSVSRRYREHDHGEPQSPANLQFESW